MNTTEFSNEFDVLYNQVNSNQAPGLDEYEKSVVLTNAQDEIVLMYFNPRGNKFLQGMDDSPEKQYDFSTLIRSNERTIYRNEYSSQLRAGTATYDPRSVITTVDEDILLITNESVVNKVSGKDAKILQVVPITYYDYTRLMQKPYKYPPKNIVWRLTFDSYINGDEPDQGYEYDFNTRFELIGSELTASASKNAQDQSYELPNWKYRCRFIKRPVPIILTDLTESDLSIHGRKTKTECELPATMHSQILQRAVEIATAIYNPQMLGTIAGFGNVSSTNIGVVPTKNDRS